MSTTHTRFAVRTAHGFYQGGRGQQAWFAAAPKTYPNRSVAYRCGLLGVGVGNFEVVEVD